MTRPSCAVGLGGGDARRFVKRYTRSHRENFAVLSWLLPAGLRDDFAAVYAFCRWSDDLSDESPDPDTALQALAVWREQLHECFAGRAEHPVFVALRPVIEEHDLPRRPFDDLLDAFEQDQRVDRYASYDELLRYCELSANPVGRLVLRMAGHRDEERFARSDATCTALQLVNHWQDVRRDVLERGRVYIPADVAAQHGLSVDQLASVIKLDAAAPQGEGCTACPPDTPGLRAVRPAFAATLRDLGNRTAALFREGRKLWPLLDRDVRRPVIAFSLGGEAVLRKIRRKRYDTLAARPKLSRLEHAALLARVAVRWTGRPPADD